MDIARQIRRFQATPADERAQAVPQAPGKASVPERVALVGRDGSKSSSVQPGLATSTRDRFRADGGNEVHGEQWQHMETRGHVGYLRRYNHEGFETDEDVITLDCWMENDVEINLLFDTAIQFDCSNSDYTRGSYRGNIAISRRFWITMEIIHNGFAATFPTGIKWPNGEKPDMTPIDGGSFFATFAITRFGAGAQATAAQRISCLGFQQVAPDPTEAP